MLELKHMATNVSGKDWCTALRRVVSQDESDIRTRNKHIKPADLIEVFNCNTLHVDYLNEKYSTDIETVFYVGLRPNYDTQLNAVSIKPTARYKSILYVPIKRENQPTLHLFYY